MLNKSVEKTISWFLFIGVPFTTLFLLTGVVTDPVNITKLLAAGSLGFAVFAIVLAYGMRELWRSSKYLLITISLLILAMVNAVAGSQSPFIQNLYGVFGRQTGLIAYLALAMTTLAAALLRTKASFEKLVWGLLFAGLINVLYCGWALIFGDFIKWNNPYGNILGLFGNPDFVSAFLGMYIAGTLGYAFTKSHSWPKTLFFLATAVLALIEIKKSHAIQGLVVTAAGVAIVGFYLVRSKSKGNLLTTIYVGLIGILGAFALEGALQKGPLASFIYKTSVSLRGQYWHAGIRMGIDHPLTGVGMDSYGNYYRLARSEYAATTLPGPGVISNASHNVVLDFFAYGGFPLLISYLLLIGIGLWTIIRVTLRQRQYDNIFVALTATWLTYELQSIISINQIGLAIWGWVLVGALVAYEYSTRPLKDEPAKGKVVKQKELIFSPQLVGGIGLLVGALVAVPPFSADSKWREAVTSGNAQKVEAALTPSYLTPPDTYRYATAVHTFESSKMFDRAYIYAKRGVEFSPNSFDAWLVLYATPNSTQADKDLALSNMKRLDPKNPNVLGH